MDNESEHPIEPPPEPLWLLVSDIDDTFLGDDGETVRLVELERAVPRFRIALNSSRPLASVSQTLEQLPGGWRPAGTVTAMGTEVTLDGRFEPEWQDRFAGWDRGPVDGLALRLGWEPHPPILQTPFKASFNLPAGADWQSARDAIAALGRPSLVVISGPGNIDVLPPNAGKGAATLYLSERLGVDLSHLIVAGDSANDLDMFRAVPRGIVVGNAREELKSALSGVQVYFASRGHAGGILEGLRHFGAIPDDRARAELIPQH